MTEQRQASWLQSLWWGWDNGKPQWLLGRVGRGAIICLELFQIAAENVTQTVRIGLPADIFRTLYCCDCTNVRLNEGAGYLLMNHMLGKAFFNFVCASAASGLLAKILSPWHWCRASKWGGCASLVYSLYKFVPIFSALLRKERCGGPDQILQVQTQTQTESITQNVTLGESKFVGRVMMQADSITEPALSLDSLFYRIVNHIFQPTPTPQPLPQSQS